jgi:flagellum-specific peptidoglycan hydrolase FlgJ
VRIPVGVQRAWIGVVWRQDFNAHGAFISRQKRYANAFACAHHPDPFAAEIAEADYSTDPACGRVLQS